MNWFSDERDTAFAKRFGLFVHFGVYAVTEWHEQSLWRREMQRREYEVLRKRFDPSDFDPDQWISIAESAGMEYICITAKHHDGFCLWHSAHTDYQIGNTPFGRDLLAELAEACARRGMGLGFYYSLPDWHHPSYPNRGRHHEMFAPRSTDTPDDRAYLDYVRAQVEELCTGYGKLVQFFWDVNVAEFEDPSLNELVRSLQPGIIINDRGPSPGDFATPERKVPDGMVFEKPTIAVQSTGRESWGYRRDEDYYSLRHLTHSIDRILSMGGNYLLNVGPRPDGTIDSRDAGTLRRIGDWYRRVGDAYRETDGCSFLLEGTGMGIVRYDLPLLTRRDDSLFVHTPIEQQTSGVMLHPLTFEPDGATLLNDGRDLETRVDVTPWRWRDRPALRIVGLPVDEYPNEPLVVRLEIPETMRS